MDDQRIKAAVLDAIARSVDAHEIAEVVRAYARGPRPTLPEDAPAASTTSVTGGTQRLLTRIVLGDILDDAILAARPQDRTFPLRLFFAELGQKLASEGTTAADEKASDAAFTLASGLNFFFRAGSPSSDPESRMRVGLEVSTQVYAFAATARLDPDLAAKAAPLLAALMNNELERLKFEAVDHVRVFDSQIHERAPGSDTTSPRIVRPVTFLCRVAANGAVKAKAQVLT